MRRSVSHRLERMAKRLTTGSALPRSSPRKGPHTRPILIEKNEARRVLIREDRKIPPSHTGQGGIDPVDTFARLAYNCGA
jgi:hypothetical protein